MSLAGLLKVAQAPASKGGNHLKDGKYELTVVNVLNKESTEGEFFIVEVEVDKAEPSDIPGTTPNSVGTRASLVWNLTKHKSAAGNALAFVLGVTGTSEAEAKADPTKFTAALKEVVSDAQPLRGNRCTAESYRKVIKSGAHAGQPITLFKWGAIAGQTDAAIAARRKEIEARGV